MLGPLRHRTAASGLLAAVVTFAALLAVPAPKAPIAAPAGAHRSRAVAIHPPRHPGARWQVHGRARQPAVEQAHPPVTPVTGNGSPELRLRPLGTVAVLDAATPHTTAVRLARVRAPPAAGR
jgi:hypothetical protein